LTRPVRLCAAAVLLAVSALPAATAKEAWRGKPPAEWSLEEALEFFSDSPWAQEDVIYGPSGRTLGVMRGGRKVVYQERHDQPPRIYSPPPLRLEPEVVQATYGLRWDSAGLVQRGLDRLRELSPVHAEMQAGAPEVPDDKIVLTARAVEPPHLLALDRLGRPTVFDSSGRPLPEEERALFPDMFSGLNEEELREAAELHIKDGERLKPERVVRHGLGASEGVSFYFPRALPAQAREAQFVFEGRQGADLKIKFKLQEMQVDGRPDY